MKRLTIIRSMVLLGAAVLLINPNKAVLGNSLGQIDGISNIKLYDDWVERQWSTTYLTAYNTYMPGDDFSLRVDAAPMALMSEYNNISGYYPDEDTYLFLSISAILVGSGIIVVGLVSRLRGHLV